MYLVSFNNTILALNYKVLSSRSRRINLLCAHHVQPRDIDQDLEILEVLMILKTHVFCCLGNRYDQSNRVLTFHAK